MPRPAGATLADAGAASAPTRQGTSTRAEPGPARSPRGGLVRKAVAIAASLVGGVLLVSGALDVYVSYRDHRAALAALQRETALAAAARIEQFLGDLERTVRWVARPPAGATPPLDQHRLDFRRLLGQVPAVTELSLLDAFGRELLRVSRRTAEVVGSQADFSGEPRFTEARAGRTYFGPVYLREGSGPHLTIAVAGPGPDPSVTAAEVNLEFIQDVVSRVRAGQRGLAYVVDARGHLIAHPDISQVFREAGLPELPQGRATPTRRAEATVGRDRAGGSVLSASASILPPGWRVVVEVPLREVLAPLYASAARAAAVVLGGLALSLVASLALARRVGAAIGALQDGAAHLKAGRLDHRIAIRTGGELETLAERLNEAAVELEASRTSLLRRLEERTRELAETLEQQTATAEILRVISSSPGDTRPIFAAIAERATRLCQGLFTAVFRYDGEQLHFVAHHNLSPGGLEFVRTAYPMRPHRGQLAGRAILERGVIHVPDLAADPEYDHEAARRGGWRSMLAVPMLREGVPIGTINVAREEPAPFSEKQIALLQTFAAQAVIAIENGRLFQELQARTREQGRSVEELRALSELGQAVSSTLDLPTVLATVVTRAVQLTATEGGAIYEYEEATRTFHLRAAHRMQDELVEALQAEPIRLGEGATGRAAALRAPVQVADVLAEGESTPARVRSLLVRLGYRSVLAVPLLREQRIMGALTVWRQAAGEFPPAVVDLLQTFAGQSALAIQNARLFREIEAKGRELEGLSRNLEQLYQLSTTLQEPLSLREQLGRVLEAARQVVDLDRVFVLAATAEGDRLVHLAWAGPDEPGWTVPEGFEIPLAEAGILGHVFRQGVPVLADEAHPVPPELRLRPPYDLRAFRTRSFLAVPMIARGRAVGVLTADNKRTRRPIPPQTLELLRTFAAHAAMAVDNARLFRELEQKTRELEAASRHKSEFLANMSHELRTPLNAIIGFSEVLQERMFGELNPKQAEYVHDIHDSGRHLLSLINDILDLSKVEAGRMELELSRFDLPAALEGCLLMVRERASQHGLALTLEVDPRLGPFVGDERKIRQVVLNLLSNAVKFTPPGGEVAVTAAPTEGGVAIAVRDTGIGIAPEDQEAIFEEFRQVGTDYARKREGTGLGLTLARRFVALHGGRLEVRSEPGRGSTFTVTLPVRPWPAS